jgi:membrane protease YdiL (CAAX protease family)
MSANLSDRHAADIDRAYAWLGNGRLRCVIVGEEGIRAGWSALLFAAMFVVLEALQQAVFRHFVTVPDKAPIQLRLGLLQEAVEVLIVFAATFVMSRIEKRRVASYGYSDDRKLIRLASGAGWGIACMSLLVGVMWIAGWIEFEELMLTGSEAWKYGIAWGAGFLLVGLLEESLLRGYLQSTLTRGIGFWWAALLLSIMFAAGHLGNGGETPLGLLEVFLGGFVFCISLWYTKSLWWGIGFHAGWDWCQSFLYGTPDSGLMMENHLLVSHARGNPLWSGGTTGPEGSVLILPFTILLAAGMWVWWGRGKNGRTSDASLRVNRASEGPS